MKYDLFISDFDGTLVREDGTISHRTREGIARFREKGGIFAVCTGRMLPSVLPRLKELGISDGLVVAFQGATVYDIATGKLLKDDAFSDGEALPIIRLLEEGGHHFHVYTQDALYVNQRDDMLKVYERLSGMQATVITDELLSSFTERNDLRVVKLLIMLEPSGRKALMEKLEASLGEKYYVTCSHPWMIEIMPKGQNKGAAIGFLSEYYGIPVDKIAAVGDQLNDLPMLEAAGGKFTVKNGADELKAIAEVVPSNDEDGVAYLLKKITEE